MLKDIEKRIENILYITQDYDESVEKEIDKLSKKSKFILEQTKLIEMQ